MMTKNEAKKKSYSESLQTLNSMFCSSRKGLEGSVCENCGLNHTVTEEYLRQEGKKWLKFLEENPFNEEWTGISFIKKFFGFEGDE